MCQPARQQCSVERVFSWVNKFITKYKFAFFSSLIVGTLTYFFAFTNKLINHDEVISMFAKGSGLSSGRWALHLMHYIFPNYSMPWIYGIISILLIAVASCIIVSVFDIKNKVLQILLSGSIMAFPSLIGTFSYMFTAASYAFAFLLSVIAFYFFTRDSYIYNILGVLALAVSLGIYQSYISVAAGLMLVFLLKELFYSQQSFFSILKKGLLFLAGLAVSLGCYYLILQILLHVTGTELNSYATAGLTSASSIFEKIISAYYGFVDIVWQRKFNLITTGLSEKIHILMFAVSAILALVQWIKMNAAKKILAFIVILLLPLAINCMYVFSSEDSIHTLVLYGFIAIYVLFVLLLDNIEFKDVQAKPQKIFFTVAKEIIAWGMVLVLTANIYVGNMVYLRMYLCYENMYGYYSSVMTLAKATPGFDSSSKIALVGWAGNTLHFHTDFDSSISDIAGTHGINVNAYTREAFIRNFIGTEIPFANQYEKEEIKKTAEFAEMPIYPYYGSIKKIGDYVVVKFE